MAHKEEKILRLIRSDVGMVISIISFAAMVLAPFYSVKIDIAVMQNDIKTFIASLKENDITDKAQDTKLVDIQKDVSQIKGALGQRGVNVMKAQTTVESN